MSESIWRSDRDWGNAGGLHVSVAGAGQELPALSWARWLKGNLVSLQQETRIPAAGAVAQFIHESFNPGGLVLSRLAGEYNNLAGMKWARDRWQAKHGGRPVSMTTWEEVDGERQDLDDVFCAFPDLSHFLEAYAELLHFPRYRSALDYAGQPLLWLHQVWASGWATDSRYLGGLGRWMAAIWPDYADTVPAARAALVDMPRVDVVTRDGAVLARGWLIDPDGPGPDGVRAVALVRELEEAHGLVVEFDADRPAVIVSWPGVVPK